MLARAEHAIRPLLWLLLLLAIEALVVVILGWPNVVLVEMS